MELDRLLRPETRWLQLFVESASKAYDAAMALQRAGSGRVAVRVLRGQKMRTTAGLFDEIAAALQFPPYFGENWDALDECLTDLEWLPADAYILVILDAGHLLDKEKADAKKTFWDTLARAASEWARPGSETPPRAAKAFRVLLQCTAKEEKSVRATAPLAAATHSG